MGYRIELEIASRSDSRDDSGAWSPYFILRIIFPGCSNIHSLLFYSRTRPTFAFFPFSFFFKTLVASRRRKNIKQDLSFLLFHFSVN